MSSSHNVDSYIYQQTTNLIREQTQNSNHHSSSMEYHNDFVSDPSCHFSLSTYHRPKTLSCDNFHTISEPQKHGIMSYFEHTHSDVNDYHCHQHFLISDAHDNSGNVARADVTCIYNVSNGEYNHNFSWPPEECQQYTQSTYYQSSSTTSTLYPHDHNISIAKHSDNSFNGFHHLGQQTEFDQTITNPQQALYYDDQTSAQTSNYNPSMSSSYDNNIIIHNHVTLCHQSGNTSDVEENIRQSTDLNITHTLGTSEASLPSNPKSIQFAIDRRTSQFNRKISDKQNPYQPETNSNGKPIVARFIRSNRRNNRQSKCKYHKTQSNHIDQSCHSQPNPPLSR